MALKPVPRFILIAGAAGLLVLGVRAAIKSGIIPKPAVQTSSVPSKVDLPNTQMSFPVSSSSVPAVSLPGTTLATRGGSGIRFEIWAWNAQLGMLLANGGAQTTRGSLMEKRGVNVYFTRQDDAEKMKTDLVKFADGLAGGNPNPTEGVHFVAIMGDGAAQFLQSINPVLSSKYGPEYQAVIVGSAGYSRGEDKFMGPQAWKDNPQAARGGVIAGYLRDGDWNIALYWAAQNGICNNPDETTYDPECINWVAADTYIDASQKYIAGYADDRPIVGGLGKHRTEVQAVVTWTPGDVMVAQQKGGLVSILSTKENRNQMPNVIIGIKKWCRDNRPQVEGMLGAIFDAGDQVKSSPAALRRGAEISAEVYAEESADYWEKYFHGIVETDRQGLQVPLGGSSVNNLADNVELFGLAPGSTSLLKATYTAFGRLVVEQYPKLVPTFPAYEQAVDTSFVASLYRAAPKESLAPADVAKFTSDSRVREVVARRDWHIQFDSGKATFTALAESELQDVLQALAIGGGMAIEIHGHTDSMGTVDGNQALSEARAWAVKRWLQAQSTTNFPDARIKVFAHGQLNPIAPNDSPDGRAQNRRVEIVIGTTS